MERVVYDQVSAHENGHYFMYLHLQAYTWAYQFLFQKTVLDAACGACFGSMIYSTGAKSIIAVDKDAEAIEQGKRLKYFCPITYMVKDLNQDVLPEADVCVSVETIEHLNGDGFFLKNLKTKQLVFTVPINMPSHFHKIVFKSEKGVINYLGSTGWNVIYANIQDTCVASELPDNVRGFLVSKMMMGIAERIT